jgi:protocatechuate 3,4-dioxygenase beta subunit
MYGLPGIMLVLALTACSSPLAEAPSYTVGGTISTSDGGSPEGALVRLIQSELDVGEPIGADASGAYAFAGVAAGVYTIEVSLAGYDAGRIDLLPVPGDNLSAQNIQLTKTVVIPGTYTVSGTIGVSDSGEGGSPKGAQVQLRNEAGPVGTAVSAGDDGAYAIRSVAPGTYTVEASLAGYDTGAIEAFAVTGADVAGKNLTLTKTVVIPGTYTVSGIIGVNDSASGGSPAGAKVQLRQGGTAVGSAVTVDGSGAYAISNVAPGTYTIEATHTGYNPGTISNVTVSATNITNQNITLTKAAVTYTVSGTISVDDSAGGGSPSGATVQLRNDTGPVGTAVSADAEGVYAISGVAPGTYTIEVSLEGYTTGTIDNVEVSAADVTGKDLELKKTVVVPGTYTVSGTIGVSDSGSGGSPSGASVQLRQGGTAKGAAVSADGSGAYSISGVAPGTYTIEVSLAGYDTGTDSVTVSNADLTGQNLTLQKTTYTIRGTIGVSDNGSGGSPNGAVVTLKNSGSTVGSANADSSGAYTISGVAPGTYTIEVSLAGYTTGTIPAFEVSADVTKDLTLQKTTYTISGTISLSDGGYADGAGVQLKKDGSAEGSPVSTDSSGAYAIGNVLPGTYSIEVTHTGYDTGTLTNVVVSGGNLTGQTLTLQKTGPGVTTITGKTLSAALDEVKAANAGGEYLIELGQNQTNASPYDITGFVTPVTITVDGKGYSVGWAKNTATGHITVQSGVTLILKNVTFTGNMESSNTASLIYVKSGGTFKMETGAKLTGNQASNGGAVYVSSGGTFEMTGGEITGNKSSNLGYGVYISASGGSMIMSGGSISGNTHKTNTYESNDVAIYATTSAAGSLTMSGDARIGRIWLSYNSATYFGAITIDDGFSGSDKVAIIDVSSTSFKGLQILNGSAVGSSYNRFTLGVSRSSSTVSGTALTGSINSSGVWN